MMELAEFDCVRLTQKHVDRMRVWPEGTPGTIVHIYRDDNGSAKAYEFEVAEADCLVRGLPGCVFTVQPDEVIHA
jgi:hypothetical protein